MKSQALLQVTLADWLPKSVVIGEMLTPLLDAKLLPRPEYWPGEQRAVYDWIDIVKDGKEYAVGYKNTFAGIKFFLHHYQ